MGLCKHIGIAVLFAGLLAVLVRSQTPCDITKIQQNSLDLQMCLIQVTEACKRLPNNELEINTPFQTYVEAIFITDKEDLSFCCEKFQAEEGTYFLNPVIQDGPFDHQLRTEPVLTLVPQPTTIDRLYTVVLVDLGPDSGSVGLWVSWLQVNVQDTVGLDTSTGQALAPYLGPLTISPHLLVVFRQRAGEEVRLDLPAYTRTDTPGCSLQPPRCDFNLKSFVEDAGLEVVSATFVRPRMSDYAYYARYAHKLLPETQTCQGRPGVNVQGTNIVCDPAPGGATGSGPSMVILLGIVAAVGEAFFL